MALLTDGHVGGCRPSLAQRLRLQPGEGTNPLPTEVGNGVLASCGVLHGVSTLRC